MSEGGGSNFIMSVKIKMGEMEDRMMFFCHGDDLFFFLLSLVLWLFPVERGLASLATWG